MNFNLPLLNISDLQFCAWGEREREREREKVCYVCAGICRGQKRSDTLVLELQHIVSHLVWVLETKPRWSTKAAGGLNSCDFSLAIPTLGLKKLTISFAMDWKLKKKTSNL